MSMTFHAMAEAARAPADFAANLSRCRNETNAVPFDRSLPELANADTIKHGIEFSPPDIVSRRAVTWDGMAAEAVHTTRRCKIEARFCAPVHLLALFESGERSDGFTFVAGLP